MHAIIAWIVWGAVCAWTIALLLSLLGVLSPNSRCSIKISKTLSYSPFLPFSFMATNAIASGVFLLILTVALGLTLIGYVSKLHLLWLVPVWTIIHNRIVKPMVCWIYMSWFRKKIIDGAYSPKVIRNESFEEEDRAREIAEQISERHNKHGVTLTNPETGEDLLAEMTNEQREKYRQFKINTSNISEDGKDSL